VEDQAGAVPANFNDLRERANRGDPAAQAELKQWLDSHPTVWRQLGDLAHHAQMEFIRLVAKGDCLFSESIKRRAEELRREIAGPFPTPLELVITERIVAAYLQSLYIDGQVALTDAELPKARLWLQRQLQANRLLCAATKSLLLVRELLPPEGPPAELAADASTPAKLNGKGRLAIGTNGMGSAHQPTPAAPSNRINGTAKNGKRRTLAMA
jgi:hypothetical protein